MSDERGTRREFRRASACRCGHGLNAHFHGKICTLCECASFLKRGLRAAAGVGVDATHEVVAHLDAPVGDDDSRTLKDVLSLSSPEEVESNEFRSLPGRVSYVAWRMFRFQNNLRPKRGFRQRAVRSKSVAEREWSCWEHYCNGVPRHVIATDLGIGISSVHQGIRLVKAWLEMDHGGPQRRKGRGGYDPRNEARNDAARKMRLKGFSPAQIAKRLGCSTAALARTFRHLVPRGSQTHCPSGHLYDGDNLGIDRSGRWPRRYCRACKRIKSAQRRASER